MILPHPRPSRWHDTRRRRLVLAIVCAIATVGVLDLWPAGHGLPSFPSWCQVK